MKPILFASDLHLAAERPDALRAFEAFCKGPARDAAAVYLLGDLFDWWLGDDQLRQRFAKDIARQLRGISDAGVPLYLGQGNRDFLLGEGFARAIGATLLPERERIDLFGVPTLVSHGDELCTGDAEYQRYRAHIRSDESRARLLGLPLFVRRMIAWFLRRKSRHANAMKAEAIMDVEEAAVVDTLRRYEVDRLIHGHTHRPAHHALVVDGRPRERIVLADWHDHGHYLEATPAGLVDREIR